MKPALAVLASGPATSIQDLGRPGYYRHGVTESGVMDQHAWYEGVALLDQSVSDAVTSRYAAIEFSEYGGRFQCTGAPLPLALSGAEFQAGIDGQPIRWHSTHLLQPGQVLEVGTIRSGCYGLLSVPGGFDVPLVLGSHSTHLRSGFGGLNGRTLQPGDQLRIAGYADANPSVGLSLEQADYFGQRKIRVLWGPQARYFSEDTRQRFVATCFRISSHRDRMGARLHFDGEPFVSSLGLGGVSDAVCVGDIQITGDGQPAVLLADRQPTGGYPRIATVVTADIPAFVQIRPGEEFVFEPTDMHNAQQALLEFRKRVTRLRQQCRKRVRDPSEVADLLAMQLISGVTRGD